MQEVTYVKSWFSSTVEGERERGQSLKLLKERARGGQLRHLVKAAAECPPRGEDYKRIGLSHIQD
jgi:hypothetical protein